VRLCVSMSRSTGKSPTAHWARRAYTRLIIILSDRAKHVYDAVAGVERAVPHSAVVCRELSAVHTVSSGMAVVDPAHQRLGLHLTGNVQR
jgi:hypothetical protein